MRPSGKLNTCMRKAREKNPCKSIGKIIRSRNLIRGRKESNLLSVEMNLIEIIKTCMLRMNPRKKSPW
jgi:hypothetical protein